MVCVCVCVLDSMNLFVSSNLGLKSFSNCLDPRLEIDSVWRCQTSHECKAMSAALVIPFFSSDFHSTKKSSIPTSFGNLIDHRILLLFLPNLVHLLLQVFCCFPYFCNFWFIVKKLIYVIFFKFGQESNLYNNKAKVEKLLENAISNAI